MKFFISVAISIVVALLLFIAVKRLPRERRFVFYGFITFLAISTLISLLIHTSSTAEYTLELAAAGLKGPVQAVLSPDGTDRFFVVGRNGAIHIMVDNELQEPPFLDITELVISTGVEQGLLSMAFHPDFATNDMFYVNYTSLDGNVILASYRTRPGNPDLADPESAAVVLEIPKQTDNHNGGTILFGPDGYLYLSLGDDSQIETSGAQRLDNYLGKILRLDVSDPTGAYKIPADNPFVNTPGALPEIWAYGLRNPWRIAFDPQTSDLYLPDVGSQEWEEVNFQPAGRGVGANYGWPWYEATHLRNTEGSEAIDGGDLVFPVAEYPHDTTGGCAIIGGGVYYGNSLPQLKGKFLFSDYCYGYVWALTMREDGTASVEVLLRDPALHPSGFAVDDAGEFYILDFNAGRMLKLVERKLFGRLLGN